MVSLGSACALATSVALAAFVSDFCAGFALSAGLLASDAMGTIGAGSNKGWLVQAAIASAMPEATSHRQEREASAHNAMGSGGIYVSSASIGHPVRHRQDASDLRSTEPSCR